MAAEVVDAMPAAADDGDEPKTQQIKYLIVTGGTLSGLGKGTTISSIGVVLKSLGFRVTAIKIDPYLNIDAGTMSPYEHGEVYVLDDGGEVDLDLGNYERFLDVKLTRDHNITTGKIYERVMTFERDGRYLGKTVQVVPHVTFAVQAWIERVAHRSVDGLRGTPEICLVEVGGTVGDIESGMYLEALQQFSHNVGLDNICICHVSFVPVMGTVGEQKTKPTQHSVKELRQSGIKPDFIFCRSAEPVSSSAKHKIAMFGQVPPEHVISVHDVPNVYHVPQMINAQGFGDLVCKRLSLEPKPKVEPTAEGMSKDTTAKATDHTKTTDENSVSGHGLSLGGRLMSEHGPSVLEIWQLLARRVDEAKSCVTIGLIGKYTGLADSYLSVIKALRHAAIEIKTRLSIEFVESTSLEDEMEVTDKSQYDEAWATLKKVDGILCPGGFGDRGIIGKSLSSRFCRHNKVPYLGICLGMQTAVIDICRELGYQDANSFEFDEMTKHRVIVHMPEIDPNKMGGTMRLGSRTTILRDKESLAAKLYDQADEVHERHRHRYEVNVDYVPAMEAAGFKFVGSEEAGTRMEIAEIKDHPFFLCTQYHPEFTSRPLKPNPCFLGFLLASCGQLQQRLKKYDGHLYPGRELFRPDGTFNDDV